MNAVTTRPFEVSLGSAASLQPAYLHPGFIGSAYQKPGEKRIVTTDQNGTLGTTSYSPDQLVESIGAVGALSAAMGSVPIAPCCQMKPCVVVSALAPTAVNTPVRWVVPRKWRSFVL